MPGGRREKRLGHDRRLPGAPEVDYEKAIVASRVEETQDENLGPEDRAIHFATFLAGESRLCAAQPDEVAIQLTDLRKFLALGEVEFAAGKGSRRGGVGEAMLYRLRFHPGKLLEKIKAAPADRLVQFLAHVRKVEKGTRCAKFLSLEKKRRPGAEQEKRGHGPVAAGRSMQARAFPIDGVGDLIMVCDERHHALRRQVAAGPATAFFLPAVKLPLVKKAVLDRGDKFLRRAAVVGVVGRVAAGQRDERGVMQVIVPKAIEPVAAGGGWPHEFRFLRLVLGDQDDRALARRLARGAAERGQDVLGGVRRKYFAWRRSENRRNEIRQSSSGRC